MRKEKFLLVLASLAFLLLFGVVNSHAQGTVTGYQATLDAQDFDVTGTNFADPSEAITILKAEVDLLMTADTENMTEAEEADHGVRISYYPHLVQQIQTQNDVSVALPSSAGFLVDMVESHKAGLGLDVQVIYQATADLLSN